MEGQADFLAEWEAMGGWEKSTKYFNDVMSLDAAAVHRALLHHVDPDQASLLIYRPRANPVFEESAAAVRARLDSLSSAYPVSSTAAPTR